MVSKHNKVQSIPLIPWDILNFNESRSKERGKAFEYAFDCDVFVPLRNWTDDKTIVNTLTQRHCLLTLFYLHYKSSSSAVLIRHSKKY